MNIINLITKIQHLTHNPIAMLILGATAISFSGVWVKIAEVSPGTSAFYRVFFGLIFLLFISLQTREKIAPTRSQVILGLLSGCVFALDLIFWHHSIFLVGPGLATILGNFQVFVLACVGIFFLKERYSSLLVIAIPMAVAGLFLIIGPESTAMSADYLNGIYFGLATALMYSSYILFLKRLSSICSNNLIPMLLVSFFTSLFLGIYLIISGDPLDSLAIPSLKSLGSLASLGLFSQCLGWLLIAASLPRADTSYTGMILLLQPSLSFVWDVLFFARPTDISNWIGVIITLSAIYLGLQSKCQKI